MKIAALLLVLLAMAPAGRSLACDRDGITFNALHCDEPCRIASRTDPRDARLAMTTEDGDASLLITDDVVALQLSDRALKRARTQLREEERDDDNVVAAAIKAVVVSAVRSLLDHSIECPLRDVRSAEWRDGRLVLTGVDGASLFDGVDVDGHDVMEGFSERAAREFVREFRHAKDRLRDDR